MKWIRITTAIVLLTVLVLVIRSHQESVPPPLTIFATDNISPDDSKLPHRDPDSSAASATHVTAWVTLSPHCPISNGCIPALNRLAGEYSGRGVRVVGIVPGAAATVRQKDEYVEKFHITFEVLHDERHQLCRKLRMTHTPQVVLTGRQQERVYSGRIDDRFTRVAGTSRTARDETLKNAIEHYLSGRHNSFTSTEPVGCVIESPPGDVSGAPSPASDVTFSRDVAPILFEHCAHCHRAGEAGPFPLLSYEDARQHAEQIALVVEQKLMPPWKPVPDFGSFRNEHRLTTEQIATVSGWVRNGMAEGDGTDLPPVPVFRSDWHLGPPDVELTTSEGFVIPADGPDIYQHFVIPAGIAENRLIRAFEFRPGSPEVVHHAFVYFDTTGQGRQLDQQTPEPGYNRIGTPGFAVSGSLGGWGPGGLPQPLPDGMGRPLPADSDLIVQIHYHPSGREVIDQSRVGLYFADPDAERFVTEIMVADVNLTIPPGDELHHHKAEWELPVDTYLLDATPHMHTLGRRIQAQAVTPNGEVVPLVRIDDWDFYWQDSYVYQNMIGLPAGTRIELECWFDNSSRNPLNPNSPPKTVRWGDFSDDEMGICYFRVTTNNFADYKAINQAATSYFQTMWQTYQSGKSTSRPEN